MPHCFYLFILIWATVRSCFSWAWLACQEGQRGLTSGAGNCRKGAISGAGKRQNLAEFRTYNTPIWARDPILACRTIEKKTKVCGGLNREHCILIWRTCPPYNQPLFIYLDQYISKHWDPQLFSYLILHQVSYSLNIK